MKISGNKLLEARSAAGVTRADLATIADLTHVRIWQLETEAESNINENVVNAMAIYLNVTPDQLKAEEP